MNISLFGPFTRAAVGAALLGTLAVAAAPARADSFRYSLATQQEWGPKRGFKLVFEDNAATHPHTLATMRLLLHVADGKAWRFPEFKNAWEFDREYRIKAVLGPGNAELYIDGRRVAESPGGFVPAAEMDTVRAGLDFRDRYGTTEYLIQQTALRLSTTKGQNREFSFPRPETQPLAVFALEPQNPAAGPWKMDEGEYLTIEAAFRLRRSPDPRAISPVVDRYGQASAAQWPGKIRSDDDLRRSVEEENRRHAAWGVPKSYDAYGGYTGSDWKEKATGFFRTAQRNGYWWLISPEGNPCFYVGVDTVVGTFEKTGIAGREYQFEGLPPQQGEFAAAWSGGAKDRSFGFATANLIRKYGSAWEDETWRLVTRRIKTWGFSGVGKWSGILEKAQLPAMPVIRREGVPTLGRLPDIFDPQVQAKFRSVLEERIAPQKNNPYVLGWSIGNEHDEVVLKTDIASMLKRPATVPAKRALVAHALDRIYGGDAARMAAAWKVDLQGDTPEAQRRSLEAAAPTPSDEDIETLRRHFADRYYGWMYRTVKEIDPNHLYMSFWMIPGWWENEEDWRLMARHCDVVGYDWYGAEFTDARMDRLFKETGKPVLCGEFSFPSWYDGQRGYGVFGAFTGSDAESGESYRRWVGAAARNPYSVGALWFQYRDQPLTGRNAQGNGLVWGEHYAFGVVDIADRPKWDLVERMRETNLQVAPLRLKAMQGAR